MQRAVLPILFLLMALSAGYAQIPKLTGPSAPGDAALADYFRDQVITLSSNCLANIHTLDDWTAKRAEYRRQLQEMLGLWPMPERTDLKPVITGVMTNKGFIVQKVYYQALPKLYVTANLYLPANLEQPAPASRPDLSAEALARAEASGRRPAILYECGHWAFKTNGINYGNKAIYQSDGAWYARNGYVCLVADTVLAGEIPGIHTGTRDHGLWWWNSRGYTPAGVEAWLGIRGLDYLCTRPEVDTNRIGIAGHSGGGAYSWTVTALDDRVKVAAPLAGMADARSHMLDGVIDSHCDCNFFINIYHWDFPQVAVLAAPRPLLIGGTDRDQGFRLDSTMRIYEKVRNIYQLYGATNKLGLILAPGIHDETPELQLAVMRWFNRYLKGEEKPVATVAQKFFAPQDLKVFETLPADSINSNIASSFVPMFDERGSGRASAHSSPENHSRLMSAATNSGQLRAELLAEVFTGWPDKATPMEPTRTFSVVRDGVRFSGWDFTSQPDVTLRLYLLENASNEPIEKVLLNVIGQDDWDDWAQSMVQVFGDQLRQELGVGRSAKPAISKRSPATVAHAREAVAFFAPRGIGLTAWSGDEKRFTKIRRRFMLLGQTMDGMRVWDIRRAIQTIPTLTGAAPPRIELQASDREAVNALYAALFEPTVRQLNLSDMPKSHMDAEAPDYLNVLKITDIPAVTQAVKRQATVELHSP